MVDSLLALQQQSRAKRTAQSPIRKPNNIFKQNSDQKSSYDSYQSFYSSELKQNLKFENKIPDFKMKEVNQKQSDQFQFLTKNAQFIASSGQGSPDQDTSRPQGLIVDQAIDLSSSEIDDPKIFQLLTQLVAEGSEVREMNLQDNQLTIDGYSIILQYSKQLGLEAVNLKNNLIQDSLFQTFAFKQNKRFSKIEIDLRGNPIILDTSLENADL